MYSILNGIDFQNFLDENMKIEMRVRLYICLAREEEIIGIFEI